MFSFQLRNRIFLKSEHYFAGSESIFILPTTLRLIRSTLRPMSYYLFYNYQMEIITNIWVSRYYQPLFIYFRSIFTTLRFLIQVESFFSTLLCKFHKYYCDFSLFYINWTMALAHRCFANLFALSGNKYGKSWWPYRCMSPIKVWRVSGKSIFNKLGRCSFSLDPFLIFRIS